MSDTPMELLNTFAEFSETEPTEAEFSETESTENEEMEKKSKISNLNLHFEEGKAKWTKFLSLVSSKIGIPKMSKIEFTKTLLMKMIESNFSGRGESHKLVITPKSSVFSLFTNEEKTYRIYFWDVLLSLDELLEGSLVTKRFEICYKNEESFFVAGLNLNFKQGKYIVFINKYNLLRAAELIMKSPEMFSEEQIEWFGNKTSKQMKMNAKRLEKKENKAIEKAKKEQEKEEAAKKKRELFSKLAGEKAIEEINKQLQKQEHLNANAVADSINTSVDSLQSEESSTRVFGLPIATKFD